MASWAPRAACWVDDRRAFTAMTHPRHQVTQARSAGRRKPVSRMPEIMKVQLLCPHGRNRARPACLLIKCSCAALRRSGAPRAALCLGRPAGADAPDGSRALHLDHVAHPRFRSSGTGRNLPRALRVASAMACGHPWRNPAASRRMLAAIWGRQPCDYRHVFLTCCCGNAPTKSSRTSGLQSLNGSSLLTGLFAHGRKQSAS